LKMHLRDLMALPVGLMLFFSFLFQPVCAAPHVVHFAVTGGDHDADVLKIAVECHAVGTDDVRNCCAAPGMRPAERDFSAPATAKISFAPSGYAGIGTTSPAALLNVSGPTAASSGALGSMAPQAIIMGGVPNNRMEFGVDNSGATTVDFIQSRNTGLGAQYLSFNPGGGNVGIGNISPGAPLSFANTTGDKIYLYDNGDQYGFNVSGGELRLFAGSSSNNDFISFGGQNAGTWSEKMRLTMGGNVGVSLYRPAFGCMQAAAALA
jgi:hypothetical protein